MKLKMLLAACAATSLGFVEVQAEENTAQSTPSTAGVNMTDAYIVTCIDPVSGEKYTKTIFALPRSSFGSDAAFDAYMKEKGEEACGKGNYVNYTKSSGSLNPDPGPVTGV